MKPPISSKVGAEPKPLSTDIQLRLSELIDECRKDVSEVAEPKFQALLETAAEVLGSLKTAFADYDQGREPAWRR
ncbi:MAG TPA: hypothetical protein VKC60_17080 [Opitutaceae bacterium]|nr:hypothetical protein [Opitutaceae bacterium]